MCLRPMLVYIWPCETLINRTASRITTQIFPRYAPTGFPFTMITRISLAKQASFCDRNNTSVNVQFWGQFRLVDIQTHTAKYKTLDFLKIFQSWFGSLERTNSMLLWSNFSNGMYTGLLFPPEDDIVIAIMCCVIISGALFNIYIICLLTKTKIGSLLTKVLLYNQNIIDATFCMLICSMIVSSNFTKPCQDKPINPMACHLLQNGFLSRVVCIMIVGNIVCGAADRFWSIVYPRTYRRYTKRYSAICYFGNSVYALLCSSSRLQSAILSNGICRLQTRPHYQSLFSIIESIIRYGVPTLFLVCLNTATNRELHQLRKGASRGLRRVKNSIEGTTNVIACVRKAVFLNALCLTIGLILLEIVSVTLTVLDRLESISFSLNSSTRMYFLFTAASFSTLNPCVQIVTMKSIRSTIIEHWRSRKSLHCCEAWIAVSHTP